VVVLSLKPLLSQPTLKALSLDTGRQSNPHGLTAAPFMATKPILKLIKIELAHNPAALPLSGFFIAKITASLTFNLYTRVNL